MVEASKLCMNYGSVVAVTDASFKARRGEVVGLLGPNGAGKTTTMKILATHLVPTSGNARVAGYDILKDPLEVRRRVGFLPETPPLYSEMEVAEYLDFVGKARGLSQAELKKRINYIIGACGVKEVFRTPIGTLSRGYNQRVGLAQALIHDPEVLILDEPTSGLDPIQIMGIRELIKSLSHNKTVIFSTHILQEVEAIADRILIITEGMIVADGTLEELCSRVASTQCYTLTVGASRDDLQNALDKLNELVALDYNITEDDGFSTARVEPSEAADIWDKLTELLHRNGWPIRQFRRDKVSLEDAFRYYVKEGSRRSPVVKETA